ncbi:MAG: transcriptional repressor [Phycisphaerae bacterium]|nr:transcriptional repressor [Phycisphaerae bacterium]
MTRPAFDQDHWKGRLREAGLRVTGARLDVVRTLHDSPLPMTAQDILDEVAKLGPTDRVTVYRTLNSLVELGIAHRVDPGDRTWRFGLLAKDHHQHAHFVCDDCGSIRCLDEALITVSMKGRAASDRFKVKQQDVYLHGTCEACLELPPRSATKKKRPQTR